MFVVSGSIGREERKCKKDQRVRARVREELEQLLGQCSQCVTI